MDFKPETAAALRSQINQIAAASQMLERSTEHTRGRAYLAVINQSVCRMLRIVGRMELDQRLSQSQLSPVYLDLATWLDDLSKRLSGVLSEIGISVTINCPPVLLAYTDQELLQQLLLELITHLALAGTEITVTATRKDRNIHLTVSDTGPGTAEGRSVMPEVLENREEQSSLDYARRIAALLGGTLVVSPTADCGLSLAVSIPVNDEPVSEHLENPRTNWYSGGFDPVLVALSELLPAAAFLPETLG